jgi:hypothetical protein
MPRRALVAGIAAKTLESIERAEHLIALAPVDAMEWRPAAAWKGAAAANLGHLIGHLLDCAAGFCAALHAAFPAQLGDFAELRSLQVNHSCSPEEARTRLHSYAGHIRRGFDTCTDEDLSRRLPTVFVPEGEALLSVLLGNLEHLLNHKYQLFFYLKLLGVPVGTPDLYRLAGPSQDRPR